MRQKYELFKSGSNILSLTKQQIEAEIWANENKLDKLYKDWLVEAPEAQKLQDSISTARHAISFDMLFKRASLNPHLPIKEAGEI